MSRVLAIAAHPDDETIGAGGALLRHVAAGDDVYWAVVTQATEPQWSADAIAAAAAQVDRVAAAYSFREVFRLGFPTVQLNTIPHGQLASALQKIIDRVRPEIVYIPPAPDVNLDHRIVHDAALVATRPLPGCSIRRVLAYEITTTARFGVHGFDTNVFVDISAVMDKKLEIFSLYATELREYPHPRSIEGLRVLNRERGLAIGVAAAECFHLVREIL